MISATFSEVIRDKRQDKTFSEAIEIVWGGQSKHKRSSVTVSNVRSVRLKSRDYNI